MKVPKGKRMRQLRKDLPSIKALKFRSLTEIMHVAILTGEYRDPLNPRQPNPAFRKEMYDIIDDIFAEELEDIRLTAAVEREILRRDIELMHQRALRNIEILMAERMAELTIQIHKIFREVAERAEARSLAALAVESARAVPAEAVRQNEKQFESARRESHGRLEHAFQKILGRIFSP